MAAPSLSLLRTHLFGGRALPGRGIEVVCARWSTASLARVSLQIRCTRDDKDSWREFVPLTVAMQPHVSLFPVRCSE